LQQGGESLLVELARLLGVLERTKREVSQALLDSIKESLGLDDVSLLRALYSFKTTTPNYEEMKAEIIRSLGGDPEKLSGKSLGEIVEELVGARLPTNSPKKILVGVVGFPSTEEGRLALQVLEKLKESELPENVVIEDFAADVLTVADTINDYKPDFLIVVGVAGRGREPGVYVSDLDLEGVDESFAALESVRPSLEGWISVDVLIEGLPVFLRHKPQRAVLVECEPGLEECAETLYSEVVKLVKAFSQR